MSEEEIPSEETVSKPATKVRRISNPRPRKKAKKVVEAESAPAVEEAPPEEPVVPEAPAKVAPPITSDAESAEDEITDPDISESLGMEEGGAASVGGSPNTNEAKRKRRRRKGKGSGANSNPQGEEFHPSAEGIQESHGSGNRPPQSQNNSRPPALDADAVSTKAWKIFLAEVSEEGVALINDQDARDLARRCFRLSEIFLEERTRRRRD